MLKNIAKKTLAAALLASVGQITEFRDMPDQARAKLHKAMGYALIGKHGSAEPDLDQVSEEDNPWLAELSDEDGGSRRDRSRFGRRR